MTDYTDYMAKICGNCAYFDPDDHKPDRKHRCACREGFGPVRSLLACDKYRNRDAPSDFWQDCFKIALRRGVTAEHARITANDSEFEFGGALNDLGIERERIGQP